MIINISDCQGYIWYSNQEAPEIIDDAFSLEIDDTENPFIIEGFLFSSIDKTSHSIRYVDGKYIHTKYDLNELREVEFTEIMYYAVPEVKHKRMIFRQYMRPRPDAYCEGMDVMVPAEFVFMGFNDSED